MKHQKNDVRVYVEGGGDSHQLRSDMRAAFAAFFDKTELKMRKPRVIACGSREDAFADFCTAIGQGLNALLLVDSEAPVDASHQQDNLYLPWAHLKDRDNWDKPDKAKDEDCHLMVQVMESWFLADWNAASKFFGQGFKSDAKLPHAIEVAAKVDVFKALEKATRDCKKGKYGKGAHSFKLLALISPSRVADASPWAKRFLEELSNRTS